MKLARLTSITALACVSALSAACGIGSGDETVKPQVELINRTSSAISAEGLSFINGTYGENCHGHPVGSPWSARIFGNAPPTYPLLSVTKNDGACKLEVTELIAADGTTDFDADPAFELGLTYKPARPFRDGDTLKFYGVAKISTDSFANDFTMTVLISDEPNMDVADTKTGTFAQVKSTSVSSTNVAPSDYAVSFGGLTLEVDVNNVIRLAEGFAALDGDVQGDEYVVTAADPGSTFEAVDTFWNGPSQKTEIVGSDPSIDASHFTLDDVDISAQPATRWIVVRRAEEGVPSYQVIEVTFGRPGGYN